MLDFDIDRELRNRKRYNTDTDDKMSENGSIESSGIGNPWENIGKEIPQVGVLIQEAVKEQIKGFIAPLTRQLEELT